MTIQGDSLILTPIQQISQDCSSVLSLEYFTTTSSAVSPDLETAKQRSQEMLRGCPLLPLTCHTVSHPDNEAAAVSSGGHKQLL